MAILAGLNIYISKDLEKQDTYTETWLWGVYKLIMGKEIDDLEQIPISDGEAATLGGALDEARGAASSWLTEDFEV